MILSARQQALLITVYLLQFISFLTFISVRGHQDSVHCTPPSAKSIWQKTWVKIFGTYELTDSPMPSRRLQHSVEEQLLILPKWIFMILTVSKVFLTSHCAVAFWQILQCQKPKRQRCVTVPKLYITSGRKYRSRILVENFKGMLLAWEDALLSNNGYRQSGGPSNEQ